MREALRQLAATPGPWLVIAPHMDDESLGCGMLLAERDPAQHVHVIFASDGSRSPPLASNDLTLDGLVRLRQEEARSALAALGVPEGAVEFLGFPDGALANHSAPLQSTLEARIGALRPAHVLVPFRYDRHPDHLAVNRVVTQLGFEGRIQAQIWEYFVYSEWRLLPGGDVRTYVRREDLFWTFSETSAIRKRRAVGHHRSQTTLLSPAQQRPILTKELLDRVCGGPEALLRQRTGLLGRRVLERSSWWIPVAQKLEPALKRLKDRVVATV